MTIDDAVKTVSKQSGFNYVEARKLIMALAALDILKLDEKPKPDGVWAVDDEVVALDRFGGSMWHGC